MNIQPPNQVGMQQVPPQQQPGQQNQSQQQSQQGPQSQPQQPGSQGPTQQQPGTPQQNQQIQQAQQAVSQQTQDKLDNISKVKSLIGPLKEQLAAALKTAAQLLHYNTMVDNGSSKGADAVPRFDMSIEQFYATCDQIELHLKTAIECLSLSGSSHKYMPLNVLPTRTEPTPGQEGLLYPQYLATVRSQIAFVKQVHDALMAAVQNINANE